MTSTGAADGPSGEDRWRPKSYHGQPCPQSFWLHSLAYLAESSQVTSHFQRTRRRNLGLTLAASEVPAENLGVSEPVVCATAAATVLAPRLRRLPVRAQVRLVSGWAGEVDAEAGVERLGRQGDLVSGIHPEALDAGGDVWGQHGQVLGGDPPRSAEHTSELQSQFHLVCRLLLE